MLLELQTKASFDCSSVLQDFDFAPSKKLLSSDNSIKLNCENELPASAVLAVRGCTKNSEPSVAKRPCYPSINRDTPRDYKRPPRPRPVWSTDQGESREKPDHKRPSCPHPAKDLMAHPQVAIEKVLSALSDLEVIRSHIQSFPTGV